MKDLLTFVNIETSRIKLVLCRCWCVRTTLSLNLRYGWSMKPMRRILRLIHLLNVSSRKRLSYIFCFLIVMIFVLMDHDVLDFESKNRIAESKQPCLPRVVDFSKISQLFANSSFFSWILNWIRNILTFLFFHVIVFECFAKLCFWRFSMLRSGSCVG